MLIITNISKITSSFARLIDATCDLIAFQLVYAVFVVLTKTLPSIMQA